jgi:hypothetical protein
MRGIKITVLKESADFATLDIEKLFNKVKSHKLSHKYRPNYDVSKGTEKTIRWG